VATWCEPGLSTLGPPALRAGSPTTGRPGEGTTELGSCGGVVALPMNEPPPARRGVAPPPTNGDAQRAKRAASPEAWRAVHEECAWRATARRRRRLWRAVHHPEPQIGNRSRPNPFLDARNGRPEPPRSPPAPTIGASLPLLLSQIPSRPLARLRARSARGPRVDQTRLAPDSRRPRLAPDPRRPRLAPTPRQPRLAHAHETTVTFREYLSPFACTRLSPRPPVTNFTPRPPPVRENCGAS